MRFIELEEGIFINVDTIEGIRKPDLKESRTVIWTHHRKYATTLPYETVLSILKNEELGEREVTGDEKVKSTMEKLDKVLSSAQHWAG